MAEHQAGTQFCDESGNCAGGKKKVEDGLLSLTHISFVQIRANAGPACLPMGVMNLPVHESSCTNEKVMSSPPPPLDTLHVLSNVTSEFPLVVNLKSKDYIVPDPFLIAMRVKELHSNY